MAKAELTLPSQSLPARRPAAVGLGPELCAVLSPTGKAARLGSNPGSAAHAL